MSTPKPIFHSRVVSVEVSGKDAATVTFFAGLIDEAVRNATDKLLKRCEVKKDNTGFSITTRPGPDRNRPFSQEN